MKTVVRYIIAMAVAEVSKAIEDGKWKGYTPPPMPKK